MRETRYGIFLRPDPATCWAVSQITLAVARQFGFVAGAVFPSHATLVGNLNLADESEPAKDEAPRASPPAGSQGSASTATGTAMGGTP